ncbi:MAG: tetratricopeptide repeat protein [Bacteroidota bacterium]
MKTILSPIFFIFFISSTFAQSIQVQNAYMYLREKKLDKAKLNADASVESDKTKSIPKAWLYRGQIYQAIFQDTVAKVNQLDADAKEKALESFVRCIQLDKDSVYKKEVKSGLSISAASLLNKVEDFYLPTKQFDKAIVACKILETALPYDFDESLKRRNITAGNLMHIQYRTYCAANDLDKAREMGNKLIATNFKLPSVYSSMAKLSLSQQDTSSALSYLDKGLSIFDDNMDLIVMQVDILLKQKKNDLLKQKLESALEINPDNDVLHAVLANLFEKLNDMDKAEKEYLKAIELNSKNEYAQFNLGALYFNQGNEWNKKLNDLPPNEKVKAKEYETKSDDLFIKAISYFEQYYQIKPDGAVKQRLRQLYYRLGETEKAEKYK